MSSRPPTPTGLTDMQIDDVQFFLDGVPNSMNMEMIDGFLCALTCGPARVPRDEYLSSIFGGRMPKFADKTYEKEILGMLDTHCDNIADTLNQGKTYYPFFFSDMEGRVTAHDWADGFMRGIGMRKGAWETLQNDELLKPVQAIHGELTYCLDNPGSDLTIAAKERDDMIKQMIENLATMYQRYGKQDNPDTEAKAN